MQEWFTISDFILNILLLAIITIASASYGYQVGKRKAKRMGVIELVDGRVYMRNIILRGVTAEAEAGEFGGMDNIHYIQVSPSEAINTKGTK